MKITKEEIDDLFTMAKEGTLTKWFDQWELSDNNSRSVAHEAARYGNLPDNFNRWEISTRARWSVAHEAAQNGNLPKDFDQWHIRDYRDWTVKQVAAEYNISKSRNCLDYEIL